MKTREQIVEKLNEYQSLSPELQSNLRNIGFYDALRWVIDDEEDL